MIAAETWRVDEPGAAYEERDPVVEGPGYGSSRRWEPICSLQGLSDLRPGGCRDLRSPTPLQLRSGPAGPFLFPAQGESRRNGGAALAETQSPSPDAMAPRIGSCTRRRCLCPGAAGALTSVIRRKRHLGHPARDEMAGDGNKKGLCGSYLCRRFLRFLVWFKADLDIFRSLEETSSESEKRAERQGVEWGVRSAAPRKR